MINESSRPVLLTRVVGSGWIGDRESLIREVYQTSHRYAFQTNSERTFGSLAAVRMYINTHHRPHRAIPRKVE
jgi:hypothetical protein